MENNGLATFLASLKEVGKEPYNSIGSPENGVRPFGAYGMLMENWASWSEAAGIGGMDPMDPAAQDSVAAYMAQKLFQRYGSWEMVGAAWFAGAETADRAMQSDKGVFFFKNSKTKDFVKQMSEKMKSPEMSQATLPPAAGQWLNPNGAPKGWLSPVAGANEYSNSFLVPRQNKLGIHGAIDVYAKRGTPIVAPVGGKVLSTRKGGKGGYTVKVMGNDGLTYYFAHMDSAAVVRSGDAIQAGAHLGFVGDSGNAKGTKPHLHFSVRKGSTPVNPFSYLQGAKNAGNYYAPADAQHQLEGKETANTQLNGFLQSVSVPVVGSGERVDYRTIGFDEEETDEPASTGSDREKQIVDSGRRVY